MDEVQAEDSVRAGGDGVDGGRVGLADGGSKVESVHQVVYGVDWNLSQAGEDDSALGILSNCDIWSLRLGDVLFE